VGGSRLVYIDLEGQSFTGYVHKGVSAQKCSRKEGGDDATGSHY